MLVVITVAALLIPASVILLHQYLHRTLVTGGDIAREPAADTIRELPRAA